MDDQFRASHGSDVTAFEIAHYRLEDWRRAQPDNFFISDRNIQRLLQFHWGEETYREHLPRLMKFGGVSATVIDEAVRVANDDEHLPQINDLDGQNQGRVIFHPSHHAAGRAIYDSGVLTVFEEPGNNLLSLALFYLSSLNGEAGHHFTIASTAGLIKLLQAAGSAALQARYLPRLLDSNYEHNYQGALFLTEVQGEALEGVTATTARVAESNGERTWALNGEKWLGSDVTAGLALATARVPDQESDGATLGLFLLPRQLDDGALNHIFIRRLQQKLGARTTATGEVELRDALGYQVGTIEQGFQNLTVYVSNTSRLFNAVALSASARRAYVTAWTYAQHRFSSGRPMIHDPAIQQLLAKMRSDAAAMLSGTMRIARTVDEVETGRKTDAETGAFLQMAINLNKIRAAELSHDVVQQGIEVLGANGMLEDFSVLPWLLRDNVFYQTWEGTPNLLLSQLQRDMHHYAVHEPFCDLVGRMLEPLPFKRLRREGLEQLQKIREQLASLRSMNEISAAIPFRTVTTQLTDLYYVACMGIEAAWEHFKKEDRSKQRLAEFFFDRRVMERTALEIPNYADQVSRLCADIRPTKLEKVRDDDEAQ